MSDNEEHKDIDDLYKERRVVMDAIEEEREARRGHAAWGQTKMHDEVSRRIAGYCEEFYDIMLAIWEAQDILANGEER